MNIEAQRICIAEACGVVTPSLLNCVPENQCYQDCLEVYNESVAGLPDYLNDLNACHEMEKVLEPRIDPEPSSPWDKFLVTLSGITKGGSNVHATASQRAEAFLKTLNLWKP